MPQQTPTPPDYGSAPKRPFWPRSWIVRVGLIIAAGWLILNGQVAWRQHDGGHEDRSNMKYFIEWASKQLGHAPAPAK
jgi:hypothetical protein